MSQYNDNKISQRNRTTSQTATQQRNLIGRHDVQWGEAEVVHDNGVLRYKPAGYAGRKQEQEVSWMAGTQVCWLNFVSSIFNV